jgi:hypothetical protein
MPKAKAYPTDTQEQRAADDAYLKEMKDRRTLIAANWKYYHGDHHQHLKADGTGTQDNLTINAIENIIDKSVAGLMGTDDQGNVIGIEFDIVDTPGEPGYRSVFQKMQDIFSPPEEVVNESQVFLDIVLEVNGDSALWLNVLLTGAIAGHVFLKLQPEGKEYIETGDLVPRIINLNPAFTGVFWQEDDHERVLWYRIEYELTRQDIVREISDDGEDTGRWLIYNFSKQTSQSSQWQLISDDVWDYPWPPVVDWQNASRPNSYYGKDDIRGLGALNDGLNFVASNTQRIIKHHAHPKTVITGMLEKDIKISQVDSVWSTSNPDAVVNNLEMQSDLSSSLVWINTLTRFLYDLASELSPGTVSDKLGAITNFGLRVLFRDTLAKSAVKRLLASQGMRQLARRILELGGYDWRQRVNIIWPDPLPSDPLQEAQALTLDVQQGLSRETYLERRDYDPLQEAQRRQLQFMESGQVDDFEAQTAVADSLIGEDENAGQS